MASEDVTAHSFCLKITFGPAQSVLTETTGGVGLPNSGRKQHQAVGGTPWMS
jgi:hypothetical protein